MEKEGKTSSLKKGERAEEGGRAAIAIVRLFNYIQATFENNLKVFLTGEIVTVQAFFRSLFNVPFEKYVFPT